MKEDIYDDLFEEKEEKTDFHAVLFKYIIRWHWFAASVIICLAAAWLYLKYTTPVYNISASVIIKDDKKGGAAGSNFSAFEDLGIISSSNNIDNEIEILHSKSLIKDVVCELGLYINYSTTGGFNTTDFISHTRTLPAGRCRSSHRPHTSDNQLSCRRTNGRDGHNQRNSSEQAFHQAARGNLRRSGHSYPDAQPCHPH